MQAVRVAPMFYIQWDRCHDHIYRTPCGYHHQQTVDAHLADYVHARSVSGVTVDSVFCRLRNITFEPYSVNSVMTIITARGYCRRIASAEALRCSSTTRDPMAATGCS
jgi:hypothetical protein